MERYMDLLNKLVPGMSSEEYFKAPDYWHSSDIKSVGQSINHFEKKDQQKVTDGLKDGQGGHTVLLEMENFNDRYTVMPKVDARTKAGREQKELASEKAHQEGKILVNQEDFTKWLEWKDNIHNDPIISGLFLNNKGKNEICGFFEHPTIKDVKGCFRADKLLEDQELCIDLKFMLSAHPKAFEHSIRKYRYDIQASWYLDGLKAITGKDFDFLFVVCEKSFPFNVQTYRLDDESLEKGRDDTRVYLEYYKKYSVSPLEEQKRLRGYYNGIQTLHVNWY